MVTCSHSLEEKPTLSMVGKDRKPGLSLSLTFWINQPSCPPNLGTGSQQLS